MIIQKFHIYLADLNPAYGTEPGKIRPVVVLQSDQINPYHNSTIICPLTSQLIVKAYPLRLRVGSKESGLSTESDILIDQIRAIDNIRFRKHLGKLSKVKQSQLMKCLQMLLFE